MARTIRVQAWLLGVTLLAGGEFSYAHLRRFGFWPLELMARSAWRLATTLAAAVLPGRALGALWAAPAALALIVLLTWGVAAWKEAQRGECDAERRQS